MEILKQAQLELGDAPASGVYTELVKRYGPKLAQILLQWILFRNAAVKLVPDGPQAGLLSADTLWGLVKKTLRDHRTELIELLKPNTDLLVDFILASLGD